MARQDRVTPCHGPALSSSKTIRLACSRCPRKGQYRKAALMVRFGKDITLADLRHEIAKCERQGKRGAACGVYYVDLRPKY